MNVPRCPTCSSGPLPPPTQESLAHSGCSGRTSHTPGRDVAGSSGAFASVTASQSPGRRSASLSCAGAQPGRS